MEISGRGKDIKIDREQLEEKRRKTRLDVTLICMAASLLLQVAIALFFSYVTGANFLPVMYPLVIVSFAIYLPSMVVNSK